MPKNHKLYRFFEMLKGASSRVLMLDFDGTLAPFTRRREEAEIYPQAAAIINEIMEDVRSKVVVVSGRTVADLISSLKLKTIPEVWGSHGWERRLVGGGYYIWPAGRESLTGLAKAKEMITINGLSEFLEEKPRSLALHWRGKHSSRINEIRLFADVSFREICGRYGLELREFNGGIELRVAGRNKGSVVRTMIEESPAGCVMVYVGDDLTDEDAFEAIEGRGVGILAGRKKRATRAMCFLRVPDELIDFLRKWKISTEGGSVWAE